MNKSEVLLKLPTHLRKEIKKANIMFEKSSGAVQRAITKQENVLMYRNAIESWAIEENGHRETRKYSQKPNPVDYGLKGK